MVATLMLNNKGPEPVEVKPTLFSLTGERLEAAPVIVEGESFRNIDLATFGALPGSPFEEGSLQLFHRGPDLVIGAQLYLVDEEHSLSFDEKLTEYQGAVSTQLESVWWLPSRRSTVSLILSNTSDLELTAQAVVNAGTSDPQTVDVTLSPHETRVINAQREHPNSKDDVGSASIHHSGPKGALIARALIADKTSGYSLSAQFYSPQGGKSSSYQGVGLRLGTARGDDLTPIVVARNVGDVPTDLSGRMPYTALDGSTGVVTLPGVRLAPGEASSIDIEHAIKKAIRSREISTASLEFDYTSPPGSVMMSTVSVSDDRNQVFRVPMWDVPAQRNGSGGYPWFIKGSSSTFVYIKNVTDQDQKYTFSLTYEGGVYTTGLKSVKPGQTVAFDLRAMRDNQAPDERKRRIPLNATRGKIVWSVRGPNSLGLLGRSEQVDLVKGTSSSYACFMCCPNSFRSSRIEPLSLNFSVADVNTFRGVEQDQTCYRALVPEYYVGDTWSVDNTGVVTISGFEDSADVTAVGAGSANVIGHWDVYTYTFQHNLDGPYCDTASEVTEPSAPVAVAPHINSISPAYGAPGTLIQVSIDGTGFTSDSTVQVSSGITAGGIRVVSISQVTADFTIAGNATGETVSVTVTSNGHTSNGAAFSILIPDHLLVVSDTGNTQSIPNCFSGAPKVRFITFRVVDSGGNQVGAVTLQENFTSLSTNTCLANGAGPDPDSCAYNDSGGSDSTDNISVRCNLVNGSCGYDITDKWQWCPSGGTVKTLATLTETVHANQITVNGNTTGLSGPVGP
jgi:hypothetical protein